MHPKTHARLMSILNWAIPILGYPFICAGTLGWMAGEKSILPLLIFWTALTILSEIAWRLPVRCNSPDCNGQMKKTCAWVIDWKSKLEYRCTTCNSTYEIDVYHPPFRLHYITTDHPKL